ncbi:hypothetical protein EUX98_g9061 [Antrodiella citrinella]|uniref:Small ribosomal subunit protein mS23 n=1 Tax=Antrodiella citrinella TaxID=2447956 RepID=A0A4S4M032_9APHY|nr:hypothetical protein EUX98_g9061 [Antrodiella citrinella]
MPRRFAGQVHKQASRFLRANLLKEEPAWYQAVLENPPLPLPPRAPASRTRFDLSPAASTSSDPTIASSISRRPFTINYVEDKLRRQFFHDHPFEAFRPVSLIESAKIQDEHPIQGKQWERLRQHGRNPTPEDAIRYAVNLHEHHGKSLTYAYAAAVAQFRSLRSEREVTIATAKLEADVIGIEFGRTQVERVFGLEEKAFDTWARRGPTDASALAARKRWKAIVEKNYATGTWSGGKDYVRLWQEGVRPSYLPVLDKPVLTAVGRDTAPDAAAKQAVAKAAVDKMLTPRGRAAVLKIDFMALNTNTHPPSFP